MINFNLVVGVRIFGAIRCTAYKI